MPTSFFCDACGAELPTPTSSCPICGQMPSNTASPPASLVTPLKPAALLIKRYRILEKIGEGGFSVVYKAQDLKKGELVAVKQITLAALSTREIIDATDTYNREITILRWLQHKSLPRLFNHFTDPGHWYIVLEYIKGQTLEEKLTKARKGYLSVGLVLSIGITLCNVLNYLHTLEKPVIFRDVKPANVMMVNAKKIYLIDFGIARHYREFQTKDTGPLGSPGYAAPEQYGKAQSGPRTDIYGLGATLQTLLIGKEPGEIQTDSIQPTSPIITELLALISRMMEPDPNQRPPDMLAVKQELENIQKKQGIVEASRGALWILFITLISSAPFFIGYAGLSMFVFGLICTAIATAWHFYKAKCVNPGKLSKEDIRFIFQKGLANPFGSGLLLLNFLGIWFTVFKSLFQTFHLTTLIALFVNTILIVGSLVMAIQMDHLPSFKRAGQKPSPNQRTVQAILIKQQRRK